ncbi:hypothetical protein QFC19_004231 [Naganishia cerealis]|uniref:Uncharacterized protein n=1 Tax=Naganishia cerealis TaxID=610337 RepID=A0ACC2VX18_9TREE|nr:hypothetical protein QFC19_004231 [Naganishia cerealis]
MAKAASKRVAGNNDLYLAGLKKGPSSHKAAPPVGQVSAVLLRFIFRRPRFPGYFALFINVAAFAVSAALYNHLNKVGTAKKNPQTGQVVSAGADLDAKGLLEWAWDTIYITWACAILSAIIGEKVWYLWLAVPAIAAWKIYEIAKPIIAGIRGGQAGQGGAAGAAAMQADPAGAQVGAQGDEPISKRQAKLKARMEKGDKRVQQVERRRPA